MRNIKYELICCLLLSVCNIKAASSAAIPDTTGYKLVQADEFNREGRPDSANWIYESVFVRNHKLQRDQPDNARCGNGLLVIEARKGARPNPGFVKDSPDWKKSGNKFILRLLAYLPAENKVGYTGGLRCGQGSV